MRGVICVLAVLLLLAGCVEVEIDTTLYSSGGGRRSIIVKSMPGMAPDLARSMRKSLPDRYQIKVIDPGTVVAERTFSNVKELQDEGVKATFTSSGFLTTTCVYEEKLSRSLPDPMRPPISVNYVIRMPGRITEATGAVIKDNTATWQMPLAELERGTQSKVVSAETNTKALALLIAPVAVALVGLVVVSGRRRKKGPPPGSGEVESTEAAATQSDANGEEKS